MERNKFELLLTDLYEVYNPSKKSDIPALLDKYNGQEFDAIFYMLMKYNYPKSAHYNPEIGTEKHIRTLIDKYSIGERIFINPFSDSKPKESELIEQKINSAKEQLNTTVKQTSTEVASQVEKMNVAFSDKFKEINDIHKEIQNILETSKQKINSNQEIKLNLLWSEQELNIPNEVANMSVGTRFLIVGSSGNMLGFEIKDIFEDYVSKPGTCIKEITIDKV